MAVISLVGRVLLVLVFVVSGASKLIDIPATAQDIAARVILPAEITPYMAQLETLTGMTSPELLTVAAGLLELICGFMIMFNFGARWFAVLLIMFTIVTTYYFHNFWDQVGTERIESMSQALKNLSLIGALLLIVGRERPDVPDESIYEHDIMRH